MHATLQLAMFELLLRKCLQMRHYNKPSGIIARKLAPDLVDARCCQSWHAQLLSLEMYLFSASLVRLFVADIYFCYLSCIQRKNMQVVETQHVVAERDPACSSKEPPLCFWCS